MNQKRLALAVAAALTMPSVASAEAVLYGKLNVSLDFADVSQVIRNQVNPATGELALNPDGSPRQLSQGFEGWGMANGYIPGDKRGNRLGVKGSEDLGNGLKAVYQIELGINPDDTNNNVLNNADTISYRDTFVGLTGTWGSLLVGRRDSPLKISTRKLDLWADRMADNKGTVGFTDFRYDNSISYISPSWKGLQLSATTVPAGGSTGFGTGNTNVNADQINGAYAVAAVYSNGPFYASAAFESLSNELFMSGGTSQLGQSECVPLSPDQTADVICNYVDKDWSQWRVALGLLNWKGFTLEGIYGQQQNLPGSQSFTASGPGVQASDAFLLPGGPDKVNQWQILAAYAFGNSKVLAMYGQSDYEGDYAYGGAPAPWLVNDASSLYNGGREAWAIGFDHNFSKRTMAYVLYTAVTDDQNDLPVYNPSTPLPAPGAGRTAIMGLGSDWSGISIGLMHSF